MQRLHTIQTKMTNRGWDILMVQTRPNVFYLSGFDTDPHERLLAVLLFPSGAPLVICPDMEINQIHETFPEAEIIGYTDSEDPWLKLSGFLKTNSYQVENIAVESSISWSRLNKWKEAAPLASFHEADEALLNSRLIKESEELSLMKEAAALADKGVETGIARLEEGVTEMEVVAAVEYELKRRGVREMSFSTMVLFGEKAGDPHGTPGSRRLKKGDNVLFDLGVMWKGYASDITRTVFYDSVSDEQQEVYEAVLKAQQKALSLVKPGVKIGQLDTAAREVIENAGYGPYFPHRVGHGLGIEVHEFPSMNKENTDFLQEGMTFTIEPGIYIPGRLGVRIEDDLCVTAEGCKSLTAFPKDLTIVPSV
ncbi:M24 family metallopeptidase [Alkalicoccus halolimnae]|uniref:Xaa-Pro peptidase family protein n=1 Tax=Alkalicoccus halolimnae TaxID=1667239 RepID=A0A5C7FHF8_9BACI|nr:Xaa-Pro peptidase family protein [Alkalicoccus halolimnae]TXF85724.1 aminopeptidase P family protein [Alkalicoccus halolimnae]